MLRSLDFDGQTRPDHPAVEGPYSQCWETEGVDTCTELSMCLRVFGARAPFIEERSYKTSCRSWATFKGGGGAETRPGGPRALA